MQRSIKSTQFPKIHLSIQIVFFILLNSFIHKMKLFLPPTNMPKPSSVNFIIFAQQITSSPCSSMARYKFARLRATLVPIIIPKTLLEIISIKLHQTTLQDSIHVSAMFRCHNLIGISAGPHSDSTLTPSPGLYGVLLIIISAVRVWSNKFTKFIPQLLTALRQTIKQNCNFIKTYFWGTLSKHCQNTFGRTKSVILCGRTVTPPYMLLNGHNEWSFWPFPFTFLTIPLFSSKEVF